LSGTVNSPFPKIFSGPLTAGILTAVQGPLKILGNGELTVPLKVQAAAFTATARNKIEAAGGSCEVA